jgi:Na+-translocating ferredoxin:NAD+ oxidoreductase RnfG subunit
VKTVIKSIFICVGLGTWLSVTPGPLAAPSRAAAVDFTTPQKLLSEQFHRSERVSYVRVHLEPQQRAQIEARLNRRLPKADWTFFVATTHGKPDGYALFDEEIGQHEPISFATFFDTTGHITRVEIVAYREPFGDGVRAERFRKQFVGRDEHSKFRPGEDIDAISGATISSRSLCIGVERAAALFAAAVRGKDTGALAAR